MKISTKDIVSNSEMIKNYKACRDKAEDCGKIFIIKNNLPDAVLFSINEYEKLSVFIEYMESIGVKDFATAMATWPEKGKNKTYTIDYFKNETELIISVNEVKSAHLEGENRADADALQAQSDLVHVYNDDASRQRQI